MADGTASETKRQLADKRMGHLKRERANIDPLWRELRDTFMPHRGRFTRDEEKQHKRIALLNETPIFASRTLASGLHAGLTSPARPWQKSAIRDDDLAEYGRSEEHTSELQSLMRISYAVFCLKKKKKKRKIRTNNQIHIKDKTIIITIKYKYTIKQLNINQIHTTQPHISTTYTHRIKRSKHTITIKTVPHLERQS